MRPTEPGTEGSVRPPRLNGRYVVTRAIGRGAQARVYVAWDLRLRQWRALKVLAAQFLDDEQVRARFEQEAQAMARLNHPNLVRVVDIDHDSGLPFMVMELARGGAVTDWIKRHGPVPPVLACRILAQCCDGLAHAHAVGVVHRDVKPHNVLIRDDGTVMMSDFGIAQVAEGQNITQTGTIMGTFAFMAPEQRTDAKGVDLRADVYSLGATLFTMLTAKTSAELFFAESRDAIVAGVPELLRPIVLTACRYEKEQRYQTALELKDALERRMARLPPDPPSPPLASNVLPLAERVPTEIPTSQDIEELRRMLAQHGELENPTFVPTPSPRSTADPADRAPRAPLPRREPGSMPYTMPDGPSIDVSRYRRPASPDGPLPDYVDPTTLNTPAPRLEHKPVKIDLDGARSLSSEAPPARRRSFGAVTPIAGALVGVVIGASVLFGVVTAGLVAKLQARWAYDGASAVLVQAAVDQHQVLADLALAGADTTSLHDRWDAFEGADEDDKPPAAAAFVALVEQEAGAHPLSDLGQAKVSELSRARREWQVADEHLDLIRSALFARLTGGVGL